MNTEFKKIKSGNDTHYVLEDASAGGTSSSAIASNSTDLGGVRKRSDNILAQEANKEAAPKPRNFVAKNAKMGGAGKMKDKAKTIPRKEKHKKPVAEQIKDKLSELKDRLSIAEAGYGANKGYEQGFASPTAPKLGGRGREDDEGNSEFDDKMRSLTGMIFYNVNDPAMASSLGLKQTRTGKWFLRTGNRNAQKAADGAFGPGKVWYPQNEGQVNELSKDTLSNYNDKADMDIVKKHRNRSGQSDAGDKDAVSKTDKHIDKRMKGIDRANSRLNTEEMEPQHGDTKPWAYWSFPERVAKKLYQIHKGQPIDKSAIVQLWKSDGPDRMTKFMLKPDVSAILSAYEQMCDQGPLFREDNSAVDGEYNDEAGMSHTNLHTIARAAQGLLDTIGDKENLPEWAQEKIAKVEGMLVAVWDYLKSQEEQGIDPQQGSSEADDYMRSLAEMLDLKLAEKIPKGADVDYYIKDFSKSNAPQFKGKTPAKRKQMAIAAYYGSKQKK